MPFKPNPAALLVSISLLPGAAPLAGAAEIYRWVDAHGRTADKNITCEEQWRRYRESLACFAPYRLVNGAIRAEAFKKCAEVKQPALCP